MQEIVISKFKATCFAALENVRRTGKPVRITRFGKPVAEIVPPAPPSGRDSLERSPGFSADFVAASVFLGILLAKIAYFGAPVI